jgi:Cu2+-exporting ATPase
VKKVLEETEGVTEAIVSHTEGTAVVKMTSEISNEALTKVITDNGYTVTEISAK